MGSKMELANALYQRMSSGKGFGIFKMAIIAASEKTVSAEFTVTQEMANLGDNLHGGATATIADVVTTLGLMLGSDNRPGVSVNLSVNYLKGAKIGETVVIDSETLRIGKTLAYLNFKLSKKETGDLIATGSHVKHLGS